MVFQILELADVTADGELVPANFNMHVVRTNVALSLFTDIVDGAVIAHERKAEQLQVLVEQLVASAAHRKA